MSEVLRPLLKRSPCLRHAALCGLLLLGACDRTKAELPPTSSDRSDGGASGPCMLQGPSVCPNPMPRYADVKPIFDQRCVIGHSGKTELWPLTTYQHVASWYDNVRDDIRTCAMPPPESESLIAVEDRLAILTWIACGFPP